ncbi:uncharacterized protein BX664DRAFT_264666 [Halteromyces radiatus]|uniref:uncharacterized protein n=1 Tax=Halteromyces radiatus TaxID=101107 RepID=UPI00221E6B68|nr:uncharacterized protein BX664DRAFT_264666 [Halteromyces radiatus]KAI8086375.1 hypothetical protein BX664DRAFT_264666 [Halteromyces radiatus]
MFVGSSFVTFLIIIFSVNIIQATNHRRQNCPPVITEDLHPYGINIPRTNPDYCVGFEITYPTEPGLSYQSGSMARIAWKVDKSKMKIPPDSITRIRVLNNGQLAESIPGENMTIYSLNDHSGEATFPLEIYDESAQYHYRVMVNYPGTTVHCIFESVSFNITPTTFLRYSNLGTAPPSFAIPQWIGNKNVLSK